MSALNLSAACAVAPPQTADDDSWRLGGGVDGADVLAADVEDGRGMRAPLLQEQLVRSTGSVSAARYCTPLPRDIVRCVFVR